MEGFTALLVFVVGLLLRFGIPIAGTALLVWLLRKLDAQWQAEAEREGRPTVPQAELIPQIRCWVLKDCPPEKIERCPAYAQTNIPCWQVFRDGNGRLREGCLDCEVFRKAPLPVPV